MNGKSKRQAGRGNLSKGLTCETLEALLEKFFLDELAKVWRTRVSRAHVTVDAVLFDQQVELTFDPIKDEFVTSRSRRAS